GGGGGDGGRRRATARAVGSDRDPGGDQAVGGAAARPALRDGGRVEAEARRRHARHCRGPHARAAGRAPLVGAAAARTLSAVGSDRYFLSVTSSYGADHG